MHHFFPGIREEEKQTEAENDKGGKTSDYVEILEVLEDFYANLFKKSNTDSECVKQVLGTVGAKISAAEWQLCEGDTDRGNNKSDPRITTKQKSWIRWFYK